MHQSGTQFVSSRVFTVLFMLKALRGKAMCRYFQGWIVAVSPTWNGTLELEGLKLTPEAFNRARQQACLEVTTNFARRSRIHIDDMSTR